MSTTDARPKKKLRLAERTGKNSGLIGDLSAATSPASAPMKHAAEKDAAQNMPPSSVVVESGTGGTADAAGATSEGVAAPHGRPWTVTVALPGSIVENAQTHELRSQLVGQVARACAIFNVDEIVVFSTANSAPPPISVGVGGGEGSGADGGGSGAAAAGGGRFRGGKTIGHVFMARLLQYLECPQYLRKHIFPVHHDLRSVGLLAPLDAPHHLRIDEACEFREGVVVEPGSAPGGGGHAGRDAGDGGEGGDAGEGGDDGNATSTTVYTGLRKPLRIGRPLPIGTRVTVRMPEEGSANARKAKVVPPREPRESAGMYWGYEVRVANGLAAVWSECPHASGYDLSIGTSEHGVSMLPSGGAGGADGAPSFELPPFRHLLIVFGGVEGLEPVVAAEEDLADCDDDVSSLFDQYVNLCPGQGSRTIRTEEALLVGLSALKPYIERAGR
jgi:predicted SPOUT superfamily RNA methylase MTH1